jgi:hypothetical protein
MRIAYGPLVLALPFAACRTDSTGASIQASLHEVDDPPRFSDWSAPVNVGPPVNTAFAETFSAISKDGLSLYFQCGNGPGNTGGVDIWVAQRGCTDADDPACAWQTPVNLGPTINTAFNEVGPALSRDGHRLYFASNRPGFGGLDLYVSRRRNNTDDSGWQPPENLGSGVNTSFLEGAPEFFEDDETGVVTLYFFSDRPGGLGLSDIYSSTLQADETFGPALLVEELSTSLRDEAPAIRRDGLEMFLGSDRAGSTPPGLPGQTLDLWVATRVSTTEPWSTPVNLGPEVNSEFIDTSPALSFDGTELYFHSPFRTGNVGGTMFDLWVTTRTKLHGRP